jgi:hypothetical protein
MLAVALRLLAGSPAGAYPLHPAADNTCRHPLRLPEDGILAGLMPWLSLPDYARRTGTPESTVRAAIRKGTLEGHQEQRAPGDPRVVWKVWVDEPADASSEQPQPSVAPETSQPQSTLTEPPAATTGLLAIIEGDRETIRGQAYTIGEQAARIAELEREAGRLEGRLLAAERDALAERLARAEMQASQIVEERQRAAQHPWWERLFGRMRDAPQ